MPEQPQLICDDRTRRRLLLASTLNGIDYIEVPWDDQRHVRVYFVKSPLPSITAGTIRIEGGIRERNVDIEGVAPQTDDAGIDYLEVTVDRAGDFSIYTLIIDAPGILDAAFARKPFSFKAGCPSDFDCLHEDICPVEVVEEPLIDYLVKDYAGFRRLLLDMADARIPGWRERHEADLAIALSELLAYVGDDLSYYQDAVANEAFLETARRRESVRRHVKLIDYPMHDGANARSFVHFHVGSTGVIPVSTSVLGRIEVPVEAGSFSPPGPEIGPAGAPRAVDASPAVFEVMVGAVVDPDLNEIALHTWGDTRCCLPRAATTVDLVGDVPLAPGDLLLFEEVKGTETGLPQDADVNHRQVVRLTEVTSTQDPLMTMGESGPEERGPGDPPLDVTRVAWSKEDALTFPLCVSTALADESPLPGVSVARGNIAIVDHGGTFTEAHPAEGMGIRNTNIAFRFPLRRGPLTFRPAARGAAGDPVPVDSVAALMALSPTGSEPQVVGLDVQTPGGPMPEWKPVPDLLDSDSFAREFVVETDDRGRATIRFGDDEFGQAPPDGSTIEVTYRVGNGTAGNVGRESLVHVITPDPSPADWPAITAVRNPLPAWGGAAPESIEQVKRLAPAAFHSELYRAVTEADYARAAEKLVDVSRAQATLRWTGSWYTVFVAVDPAGTDELSEELAGRVRHFLTRYKQAGYDLEIDPPIYVPLEIEIKVCVLPDHFRPDVHEAVLEALGTGDLVGGRRGFFHPDNFTFGGSVHLSELYCALEEVPGVDSAEVSVFKRYGEVAGTELADARIDIGRLEIARLDNDPNFPENGTLILHMLGGK